MHSIMATSILKMSEFFKIIGQFEACLAISSNELLLKNHPCNFPDKTTVGAIVHSTLIKLFAATNIIM